MSSLKARIRTQFPALVSVTSPVTLAKTGLSYNFGFDFNALKPSLDALYISGSFTQSGSGAVARDFQGKVRETLSVTDFGAKGDTIVLFDGAISASSTAFTSASAAFNSADIGKLIRIVGAGAAGGVLETTIAGVVSPTAVTTAAAASTTVTAAQVFYGSNDTAAIQNAINSVLIRANPSAIFIPGKIFMTTAALSVPPFTSLSLQGKGISVVSNLGSIIQPSIASDGILVQSADGVDFRSFGVIYAGSANTGKAGIRFTPPAGNFNFYSRLYNIGILNAYDGIIADRCAHAVIDATEIENYAHTAITHISPINAGDSGDNKIVNSTFLAKTGAAVSLYWSGGGGLTFNNNKCTNAAIGVQINPAAGVNTSQFNIFGNSFDGLTTNAINISRQDGTSAITELNISGNTFNLFVGSSNAVSIPVDANGIGIHTISIHSNVVFGPSSATTLFDINSVDNIAFGGNAIQSNNASTVGISFGSTVTNAVLGPNSFTGTFANDWANASAGFKVANAVTPAANRLVVSQSDRLATLATANSGLLVTSASGVPSIANQGIPQHTVGAAVAPDSLQTINANTGSSVAPPTGTNLHILGADAANNQIAMDGYGGPNTITGRLATGTQASKTVVGAGGQLLVFQGQGWDSANYFTGAKIEFRATETWSATAHGAEVALRTTPNTTTAVADALVVKNSGGLAIGNGAADPGINNLNVSGAIFTKAPVTLTGTSGTVAASDSSTIVNASGTFTLTLPAAASYPGRWITVKSIAAQLVNSASSNVVPLAGGAAGTAIFTTAAAGKWAILQSDGTNWIIMAGVTS